MDSREQNRVTTGFSIRGLYPRRSHRFTSQPPKDWLQELGVKHGFLDAETFLTITQHERRKSLRSGDPLSAMRIALDFSTLDVQSDPTTVQRMWASVLSTLRETSRETDLKLCARYAILLVLPGTSETEAAKAQARLVDSVTSRLKELPASHMRTDIVNSEVLPLSSVLGLIVPAPSPRAPSSDPDSAGRAQQDRTREENFGRRPHRASMDGFLERTAKRTLDLLGAGLGIVLLLPILVFLAASVKLTSPGPVLFRQRRVGLDGSMFTFYKFRTMRSDSTDAIHREYVRKLIKGRDPAVNFGSSEQPLFKVKPDPRVTRFGEFLRKWSLDELPQLLNVLQGNMSLVGPRPPIPYELENYEPWHFQRLWVKPGITGLWQVKGRSRTTFDDMVRMDLRYIKEWSLLFDVKLMLGTFGAVLSRRGAM